MAAFFNCLVYETSGREVVIVRPSMCLVMLEICYYDHDSGRAIIPVPITDTVGRNRPDRVYYRPDALFTER
jgi:hypothetical protein